MQTKIVLILVVAFCALLGAFGQIFFKLASKDLTFDLTSILTNWKLFVGLALYAIATILFVISLKFGNLSILYPVIATSYIWVAFLATIVLKESFPLYKWSGVFLIIIAVYIIAR